VFIVTNEKIQEITGDYDTEYLRYLLISDNQIKIFEVYNKSAKLIEYQSLLLTYQQYRINIQQDPDLTAQINCKTKFLASIKTKLKQQDYISKKRYEENFNQSLLTQFYATPTTAQLTTVMNSYQGYYSKESCQI
jgi:hypothetical protein